MTPQLSKKVADELDDIIVFLSGLNLNDLSAEHIEKYMQITDIVSAKLKRYQDQTEKAIESEAQYLTNKYGSYLTVQQISEIMQLSDPQARNWLKRNSQWTKYEGSRGGKVLIPTRIFARLMIEKEKYSSEINSFAS